MLQTCKSGLHLPRLIARTLIGQPIRCFHHRDFTPHNLRLTRSMSINSSSAPLSPFHWVLDWDGTITEKDTLDVLVDIAATNGDDHRIQQSWKGCVEAYMNDYAKSIHLLVPDGQLPQSLEEERELLKALKPVEEHSIDRVSRSRKFAGLTQHIIQQGAEGALEDGSVKLRPGIQSFFQRYPDTNILSVNWSRHFISSCLSLPASQIYANEIDATGSISSGKDDMKIIASDDKMRYFGELKSKTSLPVVYVGDSWTDIECLLAADLGICIRNEPMGSSQQKLADALERLDVRCTRLKDVVDLSSPRVAWATNFDEILKWIDQINEHGRA